MTEQRSFERLVRARMAKTGESHTAARAQLLAGADDDGSGAGAAGMPWLSCSEERIQERTGHGWEHWFDLLDSWGAESMTHTELTRRMGELLAEAPLNWNPQAIVTSFERSRGTRGVGERVGGDGYVASVSKTIGVAADEVFDAFVDPSRRAGWLPDLELSERTVNKAKTTARYDVGTAGSRLLVSVAGKGDSKSTVSIEQSRLAGTEEREEQRAYWRAALATLQSTLERA